MILTLGKKKLPHIYNMHQITLEVIELYRPQNGRYNGRNS